MYNKVKSAYVISQQNFSKTNKNSTILKDLFKSILTLYFFLHNNVYIIYFI